MAKIVVGMAIASAAAIAGGLTMIIPAPTPSATSARHLADRLPISFGIRFPNDSEFVSKASGAGLQPWTMAGSDGASPEMRQPSPASNEGVLPAKPSKVPVPKSRPVLSELTASLAPVSKSDADSQPTDPLSNVSEAVRKVFAMLEPPNATLASASPDGGITSDGTDGSVRLAAQHAALYDIAGRTVYMPDGTRLEAHSGFGDLLDDPSHVDVHDRGATPPQIYELTPREHLFHGVEALRMKPVGDGALFGRSGLLTHSYMLGPNGDSNGCVSFKDYEAFLKAYKNGDVKRLIVVPSLADRTESSAHRA